jgi:hypothetical protein
MTSIICTACGNGYVLVKAGTTGARCGEQQLPPLSCKQLFNQTAHPVFSSMHRQIAKTLCQTDLLCAALLPHLPVQLCFKTAQIVHQDLEEKGTMPSARSAQKVPK